MRWPFQVRVRYRSTMPALPSRFWVRELEAKLRRGVEVGDRQRARVGAAEGILGTDAGPAKPIPVGVGDRRQDRHCDSSANVGDAAAVDAPREALSSLAGVGATGYLKQEVACREQLQPGELDLEVGVPVAVDVTLDDGRSWRFRR